MKHGSLFDGIISDLDINPDGLIRRDIANLVAESRGSILPKGYDFWGLKFTYEGWTRNMAVQYVPGHEVVLPEDDIITWNRDTIPMRMGDGITVSTELCSEISTSNYACNKIVLVAVRNVDLLSRHPVKGVARVRGCLPVASMSSSEFLQKFYPRFIPRGIGYTLPMVHW